jgi:hypothetical protein
MVTAEHFSLLLPYCKAALILWTEGDDDPGLRFWRLSLSDARDYSIVSQYIISTVNNKYLHPTIIGLLIDILWPFVRMGSRLGHFLLISRALQLFLKW